MRRKSLFVVPGMVCVLCALVLLPFAGAQAQQAKETKPIELKFANFFPPPSGQSKAGEEFIEELHRRTAGRIKVTYYTGGSLLKAPAIIKGVETGIADIGMSHADYTPNRFPVAECAELPIGYPTAWVANQVMNDFINTFKPKEFDTVQVLWMHGNGPSMLITKKPVRTMEDMKGLSIRAPGLMAEVITALGGTPAPTPVMETYDAISKGVLQGAFTAGESVKTFKFGEVAKFVTDSWHVGPVYPFYVVMNKDSYKKLTPDLKEIFDHLCGEFRERMALTWNGIDIVGKEWGKQNGVEYIDLSKEEFDRWQKAVQPVIENYVKRMVSSGHTEAEVRGWIKYLRERSAYLAAKQIEYGIKSATGPKEMRY